MHPDPSPKRKRAGVFRNGCKSHKFPRACAWGSDCAVLVESGAHPVGRASPTSYIQVMQKFTDPLLALETSGTAGEVALALGGNVVAQRRLPGLKRNAAELLPAMEEMLAEYAMRLRDVAVVAFSGGPGSFTGVRVAATVARMLHSVVRARVVRVSTLEAIAENAVSICNRSEPTTQVVGRTFGGQQQQQPRADALQPRADALQPRADALQPRADALHVLTMLDAKRDQVYAAAYSIANDETHETISARVTDPRTFLAALSEISQVQSWLAAGEGVAACREVLLQAGIQVADESLWKPSARGVAQCGLHRAAAGQFAGVAEMLPIYLRPPECEEVYDARRKAAMVRRREGPPPGARA